MTLRGTIIEVALSNVRSELTLRGQNLDQEDFTRIWDQLNELRNMVDVLRDPPD